MSVNPLLFINFVDVVPVTMHLVGQPRNLNTFVFYLTFNQLTDVNFVNIIHNH